MLDANLKSQLNTYLQNIVRPIEIIVATDSSPERQAKSQELLALATEISSLSDQIQLREDNSNPRAPSMSIAATGESPRVTFAGIPMGHEFTSLVLALLYAGGHPPKVDEAQLEQIRNLKGEFRFESYISLSCQNCPDVVQALNLMALHNPNIQHSMIDGGVFQQEVEDRNIMAVPSVYMNGELLGQGRMTLQEIIDKLDDSAADKQAEVLNAKEPYDVLIVGGGPAGASAAIYAARKGIRTGIVADRFGGQVMDTMAIENFISVSETQGPKLVANLESHVKDYEVDIMTGQLASSLSQTSNGINIELKNGASLQSKSVIISTGARWREMNVPGEQQYRGKGVAYCPHCDGPLFKGKKVAVIGGGNSGIEAAIDLAGIVEHVTVLEFADTLRADEVLQRKARSMSNINIISSARTTEVLGNGSKVQGLTYEDRNNGQIKQLDVAGIFVQIGLMPNTEWLSDIVELTNRGEIIVDGRGQTSLPGVFAAGDVTDSAYKQIIIAMGSGATASLGAFDHLIRSSVDNTLEAVA
ncbi:alkyl hydroperoxide reductase subunit F [Aliamphritea ceti]|uniref:alkyl hydroperoxide reductase subunit F n=1 Tax=Aliamphritea ceti TaxID=1524258 RepID=UPI0021C26E58|nr:alkyl hydroperoxide reductase subunit F [Aliamphritea ceti]